MPVMPMPDFQSERSPPPNCWQCRYFAISWDHARPYSCKAMGFKSKVLPSLEVMRIDGQACRGFASKGSLPTSLPQPQPQREVVRPVQPAKPSRQVWEA